MFLRELFNFYFWHLCLSRSNLINTLINKLLFVQINFKLKLFFLHFMFLPFNTWPGAFPFQVHLLFLVFLPVVLILDNELEQRFVFGFLLSKVYEIFIFTHYSDF